MQDFIYIKAKLRVRRPRTRMPIANNRVSIFQGRKSSDASFASGAPRSSPGSSDAVGLWSYNYCTIQKSGKTLLIYLTFLKVHSLLQIILNLAE